MLELRGKIGSASFVACRPGEQLFGTIVISQIGHETRAVQIRSRPALKIDGRAFRFQPNDVVKRAVVVHLGAEHHFIIRAQCAPEAARHPRLHENGNAFDVPARRIPARRREKTVEHRNRLLGNRRDFASEDGAEKMIGGGGVVHCDQMHDFVIHRRIDALVGRRSFVDVVGRRNAEADQITGNRQGGGIAIVAQVLQKNRDVFRRGIVEQLAIETPGILKTARRMRDDVFSGLVVIHQPQIARLQ
ncbi:MAG: hypothetical protein ALAOOOJD_00509 [bacterium]|nr:hypothetical protein [bacterium]